jgi:hypothetical protein
LLEVKSGENSDASNRAPLRCVTLRYLDPALWTRMTKSKSTALPRPLDMYDFVSVMIMRWEYVMLSFANTILGGKPVATLRYGGYASEMGEDMMSNAMEMRQCVLEGERICN